MNNREFKNRIINNIRTLYSMGYHVIGKTVPMSQYALTSSIINAFENSVPRPVGINYIFENTETETHYMVEIADNGYIAMREPTAKELEDYWKKWE